MGKDNLNRNANSLILNIQHINITWQLISQKIVFSQDFFLKLLIIKIELIIELYSIDLSKNFDFWTPFKYQFLAIFKVYCQRVLFRRHFLNIFKPL